MVAGLEADQQRPEPIDVHRLVQAVVQRLLDQRMIGNLARAGRDFPRRRSGPGNSTAMRSSEAMRWICGGVRLPPMLRRMASEMLAFQRQRAVNIGESSIAWISVSSTVLLLRKRATLSSSKLCVSPSDSTMASSVAAACSSKLNVRQNFLRSARPKARLMRAPNGAWMMSCCRRIRRRSARTPACRASVVCRARLSRRRGIRPSGARPAAARLITLGDDVDGRARWSRGDLRQQRFDVRAQRETARDSSLVRAGASPSQNGMVGGWPFASSTRTRPASTRRMR